MKTIYRLVKATHRASAFSGRGALLNDGRWHRRGARVVYAADTPASAVLEVLVHAKAPEVLETAYVLFSITFDPERHRVILPDGALPEDWRVVPWPGSTQDIGMLWYTRQHSVILEVPSAVIRR